MTNASRRHVNAVSKSRASNAPRCRARRLSRPRALTKKEIIIIIKRGEKKEIGLPRRVVTLIKTRRQRRASFATLTFARGFHSEFHSSRLNTRLLAYVVTMRLLTAAVMRFLLTRCYGCQEVCSSIRYVLSLLPRNKTFATRCRTKSYLFTHTHTHTPTHCRIIISILRNT